MRSVSKICVLGASLALSGCTSLEKFLGFDTRSAPQEAGAQSSAYDIAYQEGKTHLAAGRDGLAIVAFSKALALEPTSVAALNALGTAYDGLGRYDIAQTYYHRVLALKPDDAATVNNLAVSLHLAGQPEAREALEKAQRLAPSNRTVLDNLARLQQDEAVARAQVATLTPSEAIGQSDVATQGPRIERTSEHELSLTLPPTDRQAETGRPAAALGLKQSQKLLVGEVMVLGPSQTAESLPAAPIARDIDVSALGKLDEGTYLQVSGSADPTGSSGHDEALAAHSRIRAPATPKMTAHTISDRSTASGRRHAAWTHVSAIKGSAHPALAIRLREMLRERDPAAARITRIQEVNRPKSIVLYHSGSRQGAIRVARMLAVPFQLAVDNRTDTEIRVLLGHDAGVHNQKEGKRL